MFFSLMVKILGWGFKRAMNFAEVMSMSASFVEPRTGFQMHNVYESVPHSAFTRSFNMVYVHACMCFLSVWNVHISSILWRKPSQRSDIRTDIACSISQHKLWRLQIVNTFTHSVVVCTHKYTFYNAGLKMNVIEKGSQNHVSHFFL